MGKTQQQYYDELIDPLKKQAEQLKASRLASDTQQKEQINASIDQAVHGATAQYQQRIDALPGESRALYDENALNEAVGRMRVRETLANMGMTDSGLTSSMATALQVQKGKADRQVRMNEQQQRQSLMAAIDEIVAKGETEKADKAMTIDTATRQWYDDLNARMEETARSGAATAYAADQEYAAKVEEARIKAEQDAAKYQADYDSQRRQYVQKQMIDGATSQQAWANAYAVYPVTEYEDKNYTNINNYYAMLRSGYTDAEINAYMNAGGGEAGAEALEAVIAVRAEKMVSSMNLDITAGNGGWNFTRPEKDGQRVVDSIKAQTEENPKFKSMSKAEQEMALAAAIGQMVAVSWHHAGQTDRNQTRLKVACNELGVDLEQATLYYDKYKVVEPDTRHI